MIARYANKAIGAIWTDENKLAAWQKVELAVIEARVFLGIVPEDIFLRIKGKLGLTPVDIEWWKQKESETNHDLQAWVEERRRHLPVELRQYFHEGMTSYDTEETAFLILIHQSLAQVFSGCISLKSILGESALKYRYCPMMGVSHGQHAEVQTFGKRNLTWFQEISIAEAKIAREEEALCFSKISGAIGNYGELTPEIEAKALEILGFRPYYGATQILPRQIHATLAESLAALVSVISKIGTDIRLGSRSPRPIYQEPFGKKQTGSSRMPQKQNPITGEQLEGMERIALGYLVMIMQNIRTWEERAIEQSCVERVAWPDLFHVVMRSLTACTKIMSGLRVYPDNMIKDIIDTRGTWAAGAAKGFLGENLVQFGITVDDAYKIVQLASFVAFQPEGMSEAIRVNPPTSLADAEKWVNIFSGLIREEKVLSIKDIIGGACLRVVPNLDITQAQIDEWNQALRKLFLLSVHIPAFNIMSEPLPINEGWDIIFSIQNRLNDEGFLFKQVLEV